MQGETSSIECAHQLGKLCENRHLVVNLIPYNATDVKDKLQCPSNEHMQKFRDIVASYGTFCTIRRTMGADIASACGQLVQKTKEEEASKANDVNQEQPIDIEDIVGSARSASNAGAGSLVATAVASGDDNDGASATAGSSSCRRRRTCCLVLREGSRSDPRPEKRTLSERAIVLDLTPG